MALTDEERGVLLTKMADDVVASILERSVKWVVRARGALAKEAGKKPKPAKGIGRGPRPKMQVIDGGSPPTSAATLPQDCSNVAAPDGAPPGFEEEWANSGKFRMGIREQRARRRDEATADLILNGDPTLPPSQQFEGLNYSTVNERCPDNDTEYVVTAEGADVTLYNLEALNPGRVAVEPVRITHRAQKSDPPATPPLPARVARWVRWFLDAGWTRRDVCHLFDIEPRQIPG